VTLRALALGLSLALAALAAPRANELAPDESQAREGMNALHRLGPDARQMRFEGESATRVWPIYATIGQTTSRARLHLAYTNAVSVMPEASSLDVTLNDMPVVHAPIAAGGDTAVIDVELPSGVLRPGYNALKIAASQRHRVDCSLEATYELWTQLDLATSGLTFPGQADPSPRALEDLPAISPGPSGALVIRAVAPKDWPAADIDRLMLGAQLVAIRGGFARPEVEFVERVDNRPGLYLVVGKSDALAHAGLGAFLTAGAGVSIAGGDVAGRAVVVADGRSDDEVDKALRAIAPAGWEQTRHATVPAERALANQGGFRAAGDSRISLHDLGVDSEDFSGRLYRAGFDLVLPPDFFPADYDKMSLMVDASYAGHLGYSSQILVRVNDKEAGSLPLRAPRGEPLSARPIPISLSAFRPGFNRVVIEAQTPNDQDAACAVDQILKSETRFSLFDRSELIVPRIARIARLPDLAVTTASGFPYERSAPPRPCWRARRSRRAGPFTWR
jgi:cellulose synthase operon protein B